MEKLIQPKLVTIFGGSGFIGRHTVSALAKRGYRIRVAVRRPDLAGHLQPLGNPGQIMAMQANLRNRDSIDRAVAGADHVVNAVGILAPVGRNTFSAVQEFGARQVAESVREHEAGLTHVSAIGADPDSGSDYARTKGLAERFVHEAVADAVIVRPSIVFGPEDQFFNKFADMARHSPFLPLIGGGVTRFQPVYVGDVAETIARSVDATIPSARIYELGGPDIMTFKECLETMLDVIGRKRRFVSIPFSVASLMGNIAERIPFLTPPITADQVLLLKRDNIVSEAAIAEGRTLEGIGIALSSVATVLPSYLVRFRPQGQFS